MRSNKKETGRKKQKLSLLTQILSVSYLTTALLPNATLAISKSSELSYDEQNIVTEINFEKTQKSRYLLFLATGCAMHGLDSETIESSVNLLLENGDVDFVQAAEVSPGTDLPHKKYVVGEGTYIDDKVVVKKEFTKGQTVTFNELGVTYGKSGLHFMPGLAAKEFIEATKNTNYDAIYLIYDGMIAGADYLEPLKSEDYVALRDVANVVKNNFVAHIVPPVADGGFYGVDSVVRTDFVNTFPQDGRFGTAFKNYRNTRTYFDDSYSRPDLASKYEEYGDDEFREAALHNFVINQLGMLAYIDPDLYLSVVDEQGNFTIDQAPLVEDISFPSSVVKYDSTQEVINYIKNTSVIKSIEIADKMMPGITPESLKVQKRLSDDTYEDLDESLYEYNISGQDVSVKITYENGYYSGEPLKVVISSSVSEELGSDGEEFATNDGDATVTYVSPLGDVLAQESVPSPFVRKAIKEVPEVENEEDAPEQNTAAPNTGDSILKWFVCAIVLASTAGICLVKKTR